MPGPRCGTTTPGDRGDELLASWVANAGAWSAAVRAGRIESRGVTDGAVVDAVVSRAPRRVLDLGCGEGWLARALAAHGIDAVGVDGSSELVERARERGPGSFHTATYDELVRGAVFPGDRFDAVVANFALLDADAVPLLAALAERLTPAGALIAQTVHPSSVDEPRVEGWRVEDFRDFPGEWTPMPWYYRPREAWLAVLADAGLSPAELREPRHPDTGRPVSLLLVACPRAVR